MSSKRTYFQPEWLKIKKYAGITDKKLSPLGPATSAHCSFCNKSFDLSNMGKRAMDSHVDGKGHQAKVKAMNASYGIKMFSSSTPDAQGSTTNPAAANATGDTIQAGTSTTTTLAQEGRTDHDVPPSLPTPDVGDEVSALRGLKKYVLRDEVTTAEIIWSLNCCVNHISMSAGGKSATVFRRMFPDSLIAAKLELGRLKISYLLVYGLALYYNESLVDELKERKDLVLFFDESFNRCAQRQQMDIAVRYWSKASDEVCTRYLTSAFLGRARAIDLLEAFKSSVPEILLKRVEMVSMDGPNVNFKFLRDLKIDLQKNPDDPVLLMMGSCGLHVVHNGFKAGAVKTGWEIPQFLRSAHNLFDDNPSRKASYAECSGAGSTKFPLPFSPVRWLCNASVADTALEVLANLTKFVEKVESGEAPAIISSSYKTVVNALKDPLLRCKLAFFASTARQLEPFMTEFQSNDPLAPFLYSALSTVIRNLLGGFVKEEVIPKNADVTSIDLNDQKNLISVKDFKLSHSVRAELRKVKGIKDSSVLIFKKECVAMLRGASEKIIEKSPLKYLYSLCKAVSFCDPSVISHSKSIAITRLGNCLTMYRESNRLSPSSCDVIESEFKKLVSVESVQRAIRDYSRKSLRLDRFWRDLLKRQDCSETLTAFMQRILILSHGNAFVERGFSINKEMIIENQLERSLVGLRQVYDGVQCAGGLDNVVVTKHMINKARYSRSEYESAREERVAKDKEKEAKAKEKRVLVEEVQELKAKRAKLMFEKEQEISAIEKRLKDISGLCDL